MEKILEGPYQNMFVALSGFKVLINILECNNEDCMVYKKNHTFIIGSLLNLLIVNATIIIQENALIIVHEMSQHYGIQCTLCKLDAVKSLINILLFKNNYNVKYMASETLQNIAKLRRGRKLIRLSGGIKIMVHTLNIFNSCRLNIKLNHSTVCCWSNIIIKTPNDF